MNPTFMAKTLKQKMHLAKKSGGAFFNTTLQRAPPVVGFLSLCAATLYLSGLTLAPAFAEPRTVTINKVSIEGIGDPVGTITLTAGANGVVLTTDLHSLPAGEHGFHLHQNGTCAAALKDGKMSAAEAAGGHYDPGETHRHAGPQGSGHKGDMPALMVAHDGTAKTSFTLPRLTFKDVMQRSIMIHEHGDNYSDTPLPLGGGGKRIACGVIY